MKELEIRKGSNVRRVVAPNRDEAVRLRELFLPDLVHSERRLARRLGVADVSHGFVERRSPVTAALQHVGPWTATVTCDLKSWFDSVTREQVLRALVRSGQKPDDAREIADAVTYQASWHKQPVTAQGLPTSPSAANLVGARYDAEVVRKLDALLGPRGLAYVYTRYADDLAVSLRDERQWTEVVQVLKEVANRRFGWFLHPAKTHVYLSKAGRRVVCGVAVDENGIHPTRNARRRARAADHVRSRHRRAEWRAAGHEEWISYLRRAGKEQSAIVRVEPKPEIPQPVNVDVSTIEPEPVVAPNQETKPEPNQETARQEQSARSPRRSRHWLQPAPPAAQPEYARGEWLWLAMARAPMRLSRRPRPIPYVRLWQVVCTGSPVWATAPNIIERKLLGEYHLGLFLCDVIGKWLDEHRRGGFAVSLGVWRYAAERTRRRLAKMERQPGAVGRLAALDEW